MISAKEARELFESRTEARVADTLALIEERILEAETPMIAIDDELDGLTANQRKLVLGELKEAGYQISFLRNELYIGWNELDQKIETGPFSVRIPLNGVHNVYFRSKVY